MIRKNILVFTFVSLLLFSSVQALQIEDGQDTFIMSVGESKEAFIILSDFSDNVIISTEQNGFILFNDGTYTASHTVLNNIYDNVYSLGYIINIPEGTEIDIYEQDIKITDNNDSIDFRVKIFVEKSFITKTINFFKGTAKIGTLTFQIFNALVLFIIFIFLLITIITVNNIRGRK